MRLDLINNHDPCGNTKSLTATVMAVSNTDRKKNMAIQKAEKHSMLSGSCLNLMQFNPSLLQETAPSLRMHCFIFVQKCLYI